MGKRFSSHISFSLGRSFSPFHVFRTVKLGRKDSQMAQISFGKERKNLGVFQQRDLDKSRKMARFSFVFISFLSPAASPNEHKWPDRSTHTIHKFKFFFFLSFLFSHFPQKKCNRHKEPLCNLIPGVGQHLFSKVRCLCLGKSCFIPSCCYHATF